MSNTNPCPYCAESIQKEAIFCKHCKKDLSTGKSGQASSASGETFDFFKKNKKWTIAGIVGVLVFVFYLGSQSSESNQNTEVPNQNNEVIQAVDSNEPEEQIEPERVVNEVQTEEVKTLGVSYDEVMADLTDKLPMKYMPLEDNYNEERYFGSSGDGASLEIVGDKDDISHTTLMIFMDEDTDTEELVDIILRFLFNAVPGWLEGEDWLNQGFEEINSEGVGESSAVYENKFIELKFFAGAGIIYLSVSPV